MRFEIYINPQQLLLGVNYYTETDDEFHYSTVDIYILLFLIRFEQRKKY